LIRNVSVLLFQWFKSLIDKRIRKEMPIYSEPRRDEVKIAELPAAAHVLYLNLC
jgi:hypothetical protein